jgi:hypothetical protein
MNFPQDQIDELKRLFPKASYASEGGFDYFLIQDVALAESCTPTCTDVLLCPNQREGYNSRLYFPSQIQSGKRLNWNGTSFILGRPWYAFSWQLQPTERRLTQMLASHLRGLFS